jgi:hypothetical protein
VGTGLGLYRIRWNSSLTPFHRRWIRGKASPPNPPVCTPVGGKALQLSTKGGLAGQAVTHYPPDPPKVERWAVCTRGGKVDSCYTLSTSPPSVDQVDSV